MKALSVFLTLCTTLTLSQAGPLNSTVLKFGGLCEYKRLHCHSFYSTFCPECDASGNFLPQQCSWSWTDRRCWCVDVITGETIPNTDTPLGTPSSHCDNSWYCPEGWFNFGERCYSFINTPKKWLEAEIYCQFDGANLASVHSEEENRFIISLTRGDTHDFPQTWLGGFDVIHPGYWIWSDGTTFNYKNWYDSQPYGKDDHDTDHDDNNDDHHNNHDSHHEDDDHDDHHNDHDSHHEDDDHNDHHHDNHHEDDDNPHNDHDSHHDDDDHYDHHHDSHHNDDDHYDHHHDSHHNDDDHYDHHHDSHHNDDDHYDHHHDSHHNDDDHYDHHHDSHQDDNDHDDHHHDSHQDENDHYDHHHDSHHEDDDDHSDQHHDHDDHHKDDDDQDHDSHHDDDEDHKDEKKNCLRINYDYDLKWFYTSCADSLPFVCSKKAEANI